MMNLSASQRTWMGKKKKKKHKTYFGRNGALIG